MKEDNFKDFVYEDSCVNSDKRNMSCGIYAEKRLYHSERLDVYESKVFGRSLYLDGKLQTCDFDELHYHETLAFGARQMSKHNAGDVLIIGGGDGGTLREAMKAFPETSSITLCEISQEVIDVSVHFLPQLELEESFFSTRTNVVIADGAKYIKETGKNFSYILVDCSDPENEASVLYSDDFFKDCKKRLTEYGVFAIQCPNAYMHLSFASRLRDRLENVFGKACYVQVYMPTFVSGGVGFIFASVLNDMLAENYGNQCRYASSAFLQQNSHTDFNFIPSSPIPREAVLKSLFRGEDCGFDCGSANRLRRHLENIKYGADEIQNACLEHQSVTFSVKNRSVLMESLSVGFSKHVCLQASGPAYNNISLHIDGSVSYSMLAPGVELTKSGQENYNLENCEGRIRKVTVSDTGEHVVSNLFFFFNTIVEEWQDGKVKEYIRIRQDQKNLPAFNSPYAALSKRMAALNMYPFKVWYKNCNNYEITFEYKRP